MPPPTVLILGGGLAGMCAAHSIRTCTSGRVNVILVERSLERLGGWLWSERTPNGGLLFERGCRGLRPSGTNGAAVLALVEQLGLTPQALPSSPSAKSRYLYHNHSLQELRTTLAAAASSPLTRGAPSWLLRDLFSPSLPKGVEDESVAAFAERHFGPHVARVLLDAALGGIYAGDIDRLSARTVLAPLWRASAAGVWGYGRFSSVALGMLASAWGSSKWGRLLARSSSSSTSALASSASIPPPTLPVQQQQQQQQQQSQFVKDTSQATSLSFKEGMGALPAALEKVLREDRGVEILQGWQAQHISMGDSNTTAAGKQQQQQIVAHLTPTPTTDAPTTTTATTAGRVIHVDAWISALPAPALSELLYSSLCPTTTPFLKPAAQAASSVPMASVGVVGLGWNHNPSLPHPTPHPIVPYSGFGYLVPRLSRGSSSSSSRHSGKGTVPVLGMTWDSTVFPGQARAAAAGANTTTPTTTPPQETRVTVMMGGSTSTLPVSAWDKESLARDAITAARQQARVGVSAPPSVVHVTIAAHAIPQYTVGHWGRLEAVERGLERTFGGGGRVALVGNSWRGVGASDTVEGALKVGERIAKGLLLGQVGAAATK